MARISVPRTRMPKLTSAHLIAAVALVLAMGGSATAAAMITGAQVKNGSLTGQDIKNRSLGLKDIGKSDIADLQGPRGERGPVGPMGPAGVSAYAPMPSGTVVVGGDRIYQFNTGGQPIYRYVPLTFTPTVPLSVQSGARNMWFASSSLVVDSEENNLACPGTYVSPNPTPGNLCLYVVGDQAHPIPECKTPSCNVTPNSVAITPGVVNEPDAADSKGFVVSLTSLVDDGTQLPIVWAYQAP